MVRQPGGDPAIPISNRTIIPIYNQSELTTLNAFREKFEVSGECQVQGFLGHLSSFLVSTFHDEL